MSGQNIAYVEIMGDFYSDSGELVDIEATYALLEVMEPGEKAPFELVLTDAGEDIDRYELTAMYDTTQVQTFRADVISQQAAWSPEGAYDILGEVRNPHDFALPYVQVVATCYDGTGGVVGTGFTFVEAETLAPGQSDAFKISVVNAPAGLDRYELRTLGIQEEPE